MKNPMLVPLRAAALERQLSPSDAQTLLGNVRVLQGMAQRHETQTLLRGKKLALLCSSDGGADAILFRDAASALGAHVSHIRAQLADLIQPDDVQQTARMLGRLYDAVECQGLAPSLVDVLRRDAGVPVYDGLASEAHPCAQLVDKIRAAEPSASLRELVVQAVLLSTIA